MAASVNPIRRKAHTAASVTQSLIQAVATTGTHTNATQAVDAVAMGTLPSALVAIGGTGVPSD